MTKALLTIMEDGCELSQLLKASLDENSFVVTPHSSLHNEACCASRLLVVDDYGHASSQKVIELLRTLRNCPQCQKLPLIVVSGRRGEQDAVLALAAGADDYVRRPFFTAELLARVQALLRRFPDPQKSAQETLTCGPLCLDNGRHTLECAGRSVELTATEFRILRHLMAHPGQVFPREVLLEVGVGQDSFACSRTLDTHMASIRRKLAQQRSLIRTIWGVGYRLDLHENEDEPRHAEQSTPEAGGSATKVVEEPPQTIMQAPG